MTRGWDKEKIRVPDNNRTHDLPYTRRALYPMSQKNSWRAKPLNWGHGYDSRRGLKFFLCPTLVSYWLFHLYQFLQYSILELSNSLFKVRFDECWFELYYKDLRDRHGGEFRQNFNFRCNQSTVKYHRTLFSHFYSILLLAFSIPLHNTKTEAKHFGIKSRGPKLLLETCKNVSYPG